MLVQSNKNIFKGNAIFTSIFFFFNTSSLQRGTLLIIIHYNIKIA